MAEALIPTGHEAQSYVCLRSLSGHGVGSIIASEKPKVPAARSRYCSASVRVADPREDLLAYRDDLLAVARRPTVETVIPIRPEDSYVLSRYREQFESVTNVVVPTFEQLRAVIDRQRLSEVAATAGVPAPRTTRLDAVDDWTPQQLVKSRYNVLAEGVLPEMDASEIAVEKSLTHLDAGEQPDRRALRAAMGHEPIVQEYVPSDAEYLVGALYAHGDPLALFQHRQVRGDSYTGGGGVYRKSVAIPELEAVARDLLGELDWHGLACIEYMRHEETGEFVLTEINPRMWQSLPSAVRAGADFPGYYWLAATDRREAISCDYDIGVGTHLLHGELGHLLSIIREDSPLVAKPSVAKRATEIVASCLGDPNFDYLAMDDPRPFLRGVLNKVSN